MSLKVLLADDNITAQKMGCKILSDAGHTVVAVSNGAAAMKKIVSEKPQLVILDVYMPGYTGLEVCEKVKNTIETARIPVLLTVTNMEPFSPEQGNRVKADGVLIKPFEATDLLAVVQKLEESMHAAPAADAAETVKIPALQEFDEAQWKAEAEAAGARSAPEMSAEVASAPLLGIEHLGAAPEPAAAPAEAASPVLGEDATAEFSSFDVSAPGPHVHAEHGQAGNKGAPVITPPAELEFTSAPQTGDIEVAPAAELETTAQELAADTPIVRDPALATDASDFAEFVTKFGAANAEEITVGVAMDQPPATEEPPATEKPAAAQPAGLAAPQVENVPPVPPSAPWRASQVRQSLGFSMGAAAAAAAPAPEPEVEVGMDTQPLDALPDAIAPQPEASKPDSDQENTDKLVAQFVAELQAAQAEPPAEAEPAPAPDMEPPAAAATTVMSDEHHISEAVDRVLKRYKSELIAAIRRELKS